MQRDENNLATCQNEKVNKTSYSVYGMLCAKFVLPHAIEVVCSVCFHFFSLIHMRFLRHYLDISFITKLEIGETSLCMLFFHLYVSRWTIMRCQIASNIHILFTVCLLFCAKLFQYQNEILSQTYIHFITFACINRLNNFIDGLKNIFPDLKLKTGYM